LTPDRQLLFWRNLEVRGSVSKPEFYDFPCQVEVLFENPIDSQNCRRLRCYLSPHQMTITWVDFTNILQAAFTHADPKSVKKTDKLPVFFCAFGIRTHKSCLWNVDEIVTWWKCCSLGRCLLWSAWNVDEIWFPLSNVGVGIRLGMLFWKWYGPSSTAVNFTNILWAPLFCQSTIVQKNTNTKCMWRKAVLDSIKWKKICS